MGGVFDWGLGGAKGSAGTALGLYRGPAELLTALLELRRYIEDVGVFFSPKGYIPGKASGVFDLSKEYDWCFVMIHSEYTNLTPRSLFVLR